MPTPEQCASGNYNNDPTNPFWDGGEPGRLAVCEATEGTIVFYAGGNSTVPCGAVIVADKEVAASYRADDPNHCDAKSALG
jgi:hypothetical protein